MRTGLWCGACGLFLLMATFVHAQSPTAPAGVLITLSEVSACNSGGDWIEIYNPNDTVVDLAGWKIGKNKTGIASMSGMIAAKSYKKIDFPPSFANSGFAVTLLEPQTTDPIETFPTVYKSDKSDASLQQCPSTTVPTSWIKEGEDWKLTTTLTPESANSLAQPPTATPTTSPTVSATPRPSATPTPTPKIEVPVSATPGVQPTSIFLSELYACQNDGEKEWVELHSTNSSAVTLTDWKLADDDHNEQPIQTLSMPSNGYAVVEITKYTNGMLTNAGDVVNLIDGLGKVVDTASYKNCTKGKSVAKLGSEWSETDTASRGVANPMKKSSPSPQPVSSGDGGDIRLASSENTEESSPSGFVLGSQTEEGEPQPSSTPLVYASKSNDSKSNFIAYLAIGAGIVLLVLTCAYYGWLQYKKVRLVDK